MMLHLEMSDQQSAHTFNLQDQREQQYNTLDQVYKKVSSKYSFLIASK